jgi:hypothetical protein
MSSLCVVCRAMMPVLDGLCRTVYVFVMRVIPFIVEYGLRDAF